MNKRPGFVRMIGSGAPSLLLAVTVWFGLMSPAMFGQPAAEMRIVARDPGGHGLRCGYSGKTILMLSGTPAEMGTAHGLLVGDWIKGLATGAMYLVGAGYSVNKSDWFFERMDEVMQRTAPFTPERFLLECDAMAKACGISTRDARVANFFPEMFHCSGFAVRGTATRDGRVLHARVLDYMRNINLQKYATITLFMPDDHYDWMSLGYAGFIGTVTAMNEKGLAIGEMGGRGEGNWDGIPMNLLLRRIMEEAGTVEEALAIIRSTPLTCEYYYVISDRNRDMVGLKCTPGEVSVLHPGEQNELLPPVPPDTVLISGGNRVKVLSERLTALHGSLDVQSMIETIKRPVAMSSNLHDAVFSPETLEMWCADAGKHTVACDEPYVRVSLEELREFYRAAPAAANPGQ